MHRFLRMVPTLFIIPCYYLRMLWHRRREKSRFLLFHHLVSIFITLSPPSFNTFQWVLFESPIVIPLLPSFHPLLDINPRYSAYLAYLPCYCPVCINCTSQRHSSVGIHSRSRSLCTLSRNLATIRSCFHHVHATVSVVLLLQRTGFSLWYTMFYCPLLYY
jgi:hypothetical protein